MNGWIFRLFAFARPEWRSLVLLVLFSLLRVGLDLLRPWPMTLIVDSVLKGLPLPGPLKPWIPIAVTQESLLLLLVVATVVFFLAGWLFRIGENYLRTGTSSRLRFALGSVLFDHLQRLSLRFHGRRPTGDLIKRITADTNCVRELIMDVALPLLVCLGSLAAMFAVMWKLDPVLALVAIAAAPLQALTILRFARPMEAASYVQFESQGATLAMAEQALTALPAIRAFGREEHEGLTFRRFSQTSDQAYLHSIWSQIQFRFGVEAATAIGSAAVLFLGGWHVFEGRLSVGTLLVFISYLASLYSPIETLAYMSVSFASAGAGARRVLDILDSTDTLSEAPGAAPVSGVKGAIRFENVTAGYNPERPILKNISFEVKPGELIAIVGPTGAGKTTLVSLIPRLLDPSSGGVFLDDKPIREIQLRSLRANVAVVLQEALLLPLSVADNIAYGRPAASRVEIIVAAESAQADEFIRRLPDGYDTILGQSGATLSGGERQRIAIARAFLKNAPILILDEPSSQLDAETESTLLRAIDRLVGSRTTFVIAHRFATVRKANRILVVDNGEIVESGTHEELMRRDGLYANLRAKQFLEN